MDNSNNDKRGDASRMPSHWDESLSSREDSGKSDATEKHASIRASVAESMSRWSTFINDNKIAARYGVVATVTVLTAYAISQTPLFFRYKTAAEVPSSLFGHRRQRFLIGRLMICSSHNHSSATASVNGNINGKKSLSFASNNSHVFRPVTCYLRHLSPVERILPKSWLDWILRMYPSAASFSKGSSKPEESADELIRIQIAGIQFTDHGKWSKKQPSSESAASAIHLLTITPADTPDQTLAIGEDWMHRLATQRVLVSCQLMGRIVPRSSADDGLDRPSVQRTKRPIPGMSNKASEPDYGSVQTIVARLYFRPNPMQWLSIDLGEWMVRHGYAVISDNGLYNHSESTERVVDTTSQSSRILRHNVSYMERLAKAEYQAASGSYGVWADPHYREGRADVMDEINFQQKASTWQKLWRWLRSG
jgi:hypothetical protein